MNIKIFIAIVLLILSIVYPKYFVFLGMTDKQIEEGGFLIMIYWVGGGWAMLALWIFL